MRSADAPAPAACAIVTREFLPQARVLAESYAAHYPDGRFYLLALDDVACEVGAAGSVRLLTQGDLWCPHYEEMAARYDALALSCALKPFLAITLLETCDEPRIFYFDSDIAIFSRLIEAERLLETADAVLTPHILEPIEPDGEAPDELYILSGGVYNMGFFAMRKSAETLRLLRWWASRLRTGAGRDLAAGMYLDQRWADLMPALFPTVAILRDPRYNVAFWNVNQRGLAKSGDVFTVNGEPLGFFHFSGLDPATRTFRSTHQTRIRVGADGPLYDLLDGYAGRLEASGQTRA